MNLFNYKNDFDIDAEWHFFAEPYGKVTCDGIGGIMKRQRF